MTSRILSRLFAPKGIFASPSERKKRIHPNVECLESRIAPASISLTSAGGRHADFDLGNDSSYSLEVAHGKLQMFDSAHHLVWKHNAAGIRDLSIDAGASTLTLTSPVKVAHDFNVIGSGALTINGLVNAGHEIDIRGGFVSITGSLVAQKAGVGGKIVVTGDNVALLDHAKINASGSKAGGTVLIGGGYQGGNAKVENAQKVLVESGVTISADAVKRGAGGKVILYAEDALQFTGEISARGGAQGGRGGFVETSAGIVQVLGGVKVSSVKGQQGTWLIDPNNLRIGQGGDFNITSGPGFFDTNGDDAFLSVGSLEGALNAGGNVFLTTKTAGANTQEGRIEIWDTVTKSSGADSTLTFNAHTSVVFINDGDLDAPALISTNNKLNVQVNTNYDADGSGGGFYMNYDLGNNIAATIDTNGGNFSTNTAVGPTDKGVFIDHGTITTGTGNITITGQGDAVSGGGASTGIDIVNSSTLTTTTGSISLTGKGGAVTDQFTRGVALSNNSVVQTTGGGNITITTQTNGTGTDVQGLALLGGSSVRVTGGSGAITITDTTTVNGTNAHGVLIDGGSTLSATGTGTISVTVARDIFMQGAASAATVDGNLTLNANQQVTPTAGDFWGIVVDGTISTSGSGNIVLAGRSGDNQPYEGIYVLGNGLIQSTGSGASAGTISMTGVAGTVGAQDHAEGISIQEGGIETVDGDISITGTGATAAGFANHGVFIVNFTAGTAHVRATGTADVTITGTALAGTSAGVAIEGTLPLAISTTSGALTFIGTGVNDNDISVTGSSTISSSAGSINFVGNRTEIGGGTVTATNGTVTFRQLTNGTAINLGTETVGQLSLTDLELDRVTAGTVQIGDSNSGAITISAGISHGNSLSLTSAAGVSGAGGLALAAGKNLSIGANGAINLTGVVSVPGATTLSAGANAISLINAGNDFGGLVTFSNSGANGVSITDANSLTLGLSNIGSGASTFTAANLTVSGTITSAAGGSINAAAPTISLQAPIIHPGGALTGTGATVSVGSAGLIQNGVDVSASGATVTVAAGTYAEAVDVNKAITVDLAGSIVINSLSGIVTSTVQLNANNLLTGNGSNTTYAGAINGAGGSLTKQGGGIFTLSGTNGYTGATLISGGTLSVTGSIAGSAATVGSTGTLSGTGTTAAVTVNSGGTVSPGTSPGTLSTGSVSFTAGSTFTAEVNGNTAGTHDELDVTGTVALGGATLNASGTITSNPGQVIVLIDNNGVDPVSGTFNLLPESSVVTINGVNFVLSYVGGTGNDVTLTQAESLIHLDGSGNLVIDDVAVGSDDQITLQSDTVNGNYIITDPNLFLTTNIPGATGNGTHTIIVPFGAVTGTQVNVNTGGGNDSLTVDFSLGDFSQAINYDGGTQTTSDSLTLTGGTFASVAHTFTSASSGSVAITGNSTISYTGLEPVIDNLSATNRAFTFTGGAEAITLVDAAGATMTIDSTLGESITFADPSASITINANSGVDSVTVSSMDGAYTGSLSIATDGGDTASISTGLATLSLLTAAADTINLNGVTSTGAINATGTTINLNGNLQSDGGNVLLTGAVRLGASVTIDTETGADNAAGSVTFSGGTVSATVGGADLTIDTSTVGFAGGAVTLGAFGNAGGQYINDLSINTGGSSAGLLTLGGTILLDENTAADTASLTFTGGGKIAIAAALTIDTEQGNTAGVDGGAVNLGTGVIYGTSAVNLQIATGTTAVGRTGGPINLGPVNDNGGANTFLSGLTLNGTTTTAGNTSIITLGGDIFVDGQLSIIGRIVLPASRTLDTEQGNNNNAGSLQLLGDYISASAAGVDLTINTSVAGFVGGAVALNTLTNDAGAYLNDVSINTAGTTNGTVSLRGNISLDNSGADLASFTVQGGGATSFVPAALVIDTEQGGDASGGSVDFGTSIISGAAKDLTIDTSTALAGGNGGNVTLGQVGQAGGFLRNLVINASGGGGGTVGTIRLQGNISLDENGTAPANAASFVAQGDILIAPASGTTLTIDTEQGNTANIAGNKVDFGTSRIFAAATGYTLTIDTSDSGGGANGGAVTFGAVTNGTGAYLRNLSVTTTGPASNGAITLNGDVLLDAGALTLNAGAGNIVLTGSRIIDTNQTNAASSGAVTVTGAISANVVGADLTIDTSTTFAGGNSGAISLGIIGNGAGQYINDLTINRTPGAGGTVGGLTLNGGITTNANGGDTGDISFTGAGAITLATGPISIATDAAGGGTNAGTVSFNDTTVISGNQSLSINATADGGGTAAATTLAPVNLSAGTVTVNSGSLTFNGISTVNANVILNGIGVTQNAATSVSTGTGTIAIDGGSGAINLQGSLTSTNTTASAITVQNATTVALGDVNATAGPSSGVRVGLGQNVTGTVTQNVGTSILANNFTASTAGAILLTNGTNDFGTATITNTGAGNVAITDVNAIVLGGISVGSGTLAVTAVGITQTGTVVQAGGAGAVTLNGGGGSIVLTNAGNNFTGPVTASVTGANSINIRDGSGGFNVASATTTNGSITLNAVGGNLAVTSASAGTGGAVNLSTTTSGDVQIGSVSTTGTATINAAGKIEELGSDAGVDLSAGTASLTAVSGIGSAGTIETALANLGATSATGGIDLENTGVLTLTSFTATTSGNLTLLNHGALSTSGVVSAANGAISLTTTSPITIGANMSASGNITLTAGEISDAPTFADALQVNGGVTVQSTSGTVTLRAGDDVCLLAGSTVTAPTVTIQPGFNDLDGGGSAKLFGTINTTTAFNLSAIGDIIVDLINAPGQTVTLTADSDNNGTGGILDNNGAAVNVIADILNLSASTRIAAVPSPGPFGITLDTQVNSVAAVVANGTGGIDISNTGALNVTSATTSDGSILLNATGGNLTLAGVNAGGSGDVTLTTTTSGNVLVGDVTAAGNTISATSAGAINDNNGAATNFTASVLNLTAVTGIGNGNALETVVSTVTATNGTNNIQLANTGALNVAGANVTGASGGITITAASPITISANSIAPGAITFGASETNDSPTFADVLTVNAGITVQSTGSSVTLQAGDDIALAAGSLVDAATTVTLNAANGDADNEGGITFGGTVSAAGGITGTARDNIALGGNVASSGAGVSLTSTNGAITRTAGTVSGGTLTFNAPLGVGAVGAEIQTSGTTLSFATTTGNVFIIEANGASVSGTSVSGNVNLTTTTGDWTVIGTGISTAGDATLVASAGDLLRTGAGATVSANLVTLTAGGGDGDIGTGASRFLTAANSIVFTGAGTGDIFLTESNGANVQGSTGSGAISLISTAGDWTINGNISTTGNATIVASVGDILRSAGTVSGNVLTFTTGGADGDIGAPGAAILTSGTTIAFTGSGSGDVFITEGDDAAISGSTGTGDITLVSSAGSLTLGLVSTSTAVGTVNIAAANAILDGNAGTNNIAALNAILTAGSGVGIAADRLDTTISNLEGSGGTGGFYLSDVGALNIGGISVLVGVSATAGDIAIANTGALTISELVQTPGNITLTANGSITETGGAIVTPATLTTSSSGGQTLNDLGNQIGTFTATNTGAGSGISLQNNFNSFNISNVTNQTGGDVFINNAGTDATVTGIIKSGNPILGGDITVQSAGLLTVNNTVDSRGGSGGTLTLGGLLLLNASPIVGFGNITLQGGAGPLTINAPITVSSPLVLQSTEDINILAKVETTSVTSDITVLADLDNDGDGGVYIGDNIFQGSLKAGRNLDVRGSDYLDSFAPLGIAGDSVIIQPNGANARLEAVGNVLVKNNTGAPATARIHLGGLVRSNTSGNVTFDNAIQLTDDFARALTHGTGNVIFLGEIDGGFDLRASTDAGVVLFNGAVGAVTRVGDVLVDTALDVTEIGGLTAASFTVGSATGTVELAGPVNTNGAGTNLSISTTTLLVNNTVAANAGNIFWQANNLAVSGATSGTGTLTIQPVAPGRSVGLNGPGDLNLTQAEINLFQNGFSLITIGAANSFGNVSTDGVTFLDPVAILSPAAGGVINVNGTIAGTDNASVTLQAPTINFNVANPVPVISTEADLVRVIGNIKLLKDSFIDTNFAGAGGNVTLDSTINGAFDLIIDAGNFAAGGTVAFNGAAGAPGGVSIGGTTPLSSLLVSGATIVIHPQAITTGAQTYNAATSIDTYGGALRSKTSGAITLNGPVVLHDVLPIVTSGLVGADVIFTSTVNIVPGSPGALRIDAGTLGNVTFGGNIGTSVATKLQSLEVTRANNVVFNGSAAVTGALKLDAAEIDFNGGVDSILAGTLTLQTDGANQAVTVGGAADTGANVLDITASDVAALADGIGSIVIARTAGIAGITIAGGTSFSDPVTFRQSSRTGFIDVLGNVTGTDNASLTFTGSATNLGGDLTTAGGAITTDYVNLTTNVNVTSNGGAITFGNTLLDTGAGGHSLTVNSGVGNVSFLGPVGTSGPLLGAVNVTSGGITLVKASLVAKSFTTDAAGSTQLQGTQVKATDPAGTGVHIADPITLNSSMRILTSGTAPISLDAGVNSKAGKTNSLTLQSALGNIVVNGAIGNTAMLGTLRVRDNASVTFTGPIFAKTVNIRGLTVAVDDVTTTATQTYNAQSIAFNGPIAASKLSVKATTNITATDVFNIAGQATVKTAKTADIALTNAANAFGSISLAGHHATIVEAGSTHIVTTKLTGTLDLTSGGDVLQTARITANTLTVDAAGTISFIGAGQKINHLGAIAGVGDIIILGGGADLFLDGPITTTNGDVTIASNYRGTFHNMFNTAGANVIQITGTGRYLLYAYKQSASNLNTLAFDFSELGKTYPTAPAPGNTGNGIIYAIA